jgi:hypothetical protein
MGKGNCNYTGGKKGKYKKNYMASDMLEDSNGNRINQKNRKSTFMSCPFSFPWPPDYKDYYNQEKEYGGCLLQKGCQLFPGFSRDVCKNQYDHCYHYLYEGIWVRFYISFSEFILLK